MDNFEIKVYGIKEALELIDPKVVQKAATRALSRIGAGVIGQAAKEISSEYNVTQARVRSFMFMRSPRMAGEMVMVTNAIEIVGRGLGMALAYFGARQTGTYTVTAGKGKGRITRLGHKYGRGYAGPVTVQVKRGGGRKAVSGRYSNKPFIAQMKSGHIGVFVRQSRTRKPIEQLLGPGVGGLFGSRKVRARMVTYVNSRWIPEFKANLAYYNRRYA